MYFFEEGPLGLRPMEQTEQDYVQPHAWLADARIADYYGGLNSRPMLQEVRRKYEPRVLGEEPVVPCIAEYEGIPLGYVQFYPVEEAEYDCRGLVDFSLYAKPMAVDLFLGQPERWNQGLGSRLLRALCRYLSDEVGADAIFIDPRLNNPRAIRCYEKAGFRRLCVIPQREEMDGRRWDNLMMRWTKGEQK